MSLSHPIITNLNEVKPQLFQRQREEEEEQYRQVQKKVEKRVQIYEQPVRSKEQEELRDRRISKGMEKLQAMLLQKKEMKMIGYIDIYVKYEMVSYMITRVLTAVRTRNLIGAFMKISSYGYNKYTKKEKIGRMFYHLECLSYQRKRSAFFQIQRAALNNKAIQTSLKSLMFLFQKKEVTYKKIALTNMRSLIGVSRTFVKGKFSQYHFLAMKFQDIFRKCAQRKKRDALNALFKNNVQLESQIHMYRQTEQKKQYLVKKIFSLLVRNKLKDAFGQIQISAKQIELKEAKRNAALRSLMTFIRNKQRMQIESAFLSIQQEQHISLSKEKIKQEKQSNALKHEQSKSLRNKAIAYRIAGIFQKLVDKRKSEAFRKVVLTTFKQTELQQQRLQKLSKVFINILNRRLNKLCSDAFSNIKWTSNNKFIKKRMATQAITNFLNKKVKENIKSSLVKLKSHRFVDAYQSRQRKTQSKSFYLMLSVKLKQIFENRKKKNLAIGFTKIKIVKKQQDNLSKLVNNMTKYQLRNSFNLLKKNDNKIKIITKAVNTLQKLQNSIEKESLFSSWNRLLRCKLVKRQNTSKALVVIMTLQNIFKNQKRNALAAVQKYSNAMQIKQRAANRLGQKLHKIERKQLQSSFQQIKQYGEMKFKLLKRFVSILRVPYTNLMKQSFETIRDFDIDTYQEIKESNQYVVSQIQNIIENDNKYVSPLSKRQMIQQQYEQDYQVSGNRQSFNNGNSSSYPQVAQQLLASPSTDRTIKLNSTTPFRLSAIKLQQPLLISQEEMQQKQRQRYTYIANILNRKSKLAMKRQLQNAFDNISLICQQRRSLEQVIANIGERQQRQYMQSAFNCLKESDEKKQLAFNLISKLTKVFKNAALLPHYLHFMNILKENRMSKIYVETYQNLEISQQKKRALQATLKQGELQSMNEVLSSVNNLNAQQKQLYTKVAYSLENAILNTKRAAFESLKLRYQEAKLIPLVKGLQRYSDQFQQFNLQNSFNQIQQVGSIYHKSKQLTIFCQKLSLIISKKVLQQKYEGLFSIREQSSNVIQTHNFSEIKKNALAKIILKQRQKHLLSSFLNTTNQEFILFINSLWKRINKEFNIKKNLENESVNNDLYFEVISFLNQRKNFENVIDNELKKIQNSALKTNIDSDKKPYKIQSNSKVNQFQGSSLKQNSAVRESLDKNKSFKTTSSSFNVTSFYPESTGTHQQEKRYDSGDYILDSYQYQLQSSKKQLYDQFIGQSKVFSPQNPHLDSNNINNQFIPAGVPIIEEDEEQVASVTQNYNQLNQNIKPQMYAEGVADFSFTEQENEKY